MEFYTREVLLLKLVVKGKAQVKFSYSITCHKSQGGQWENVLVDLGYFKNDMLDLSYLRWLYTAITRASKKLYLINFSNAFFN